MNKEMTDTVRCLFWFGLVVLFIICLPEILAAIGAGIVYLFQAIAMIIIGYIAVAIIYGLLSMFCGEEFKGFSAKYDADAEAEKTWTFA